MSIGIPVYGVLSDMVSVDKAESLVSHEQSKIKDVSIKKITHFSHLSLSYIRVKNLLCIVNQIVEMLRNTMIYHSHF